MYVSSVFRSFTRTWLVIKPRCANDLLTKPRHSTDVLTAVHASNGFIEVSPTVCNGRSKKKKKRV